MPDPAQYEIRVRGHLSSQWADRFGGLAIDNLPDGDALLSGALNRILCLGLTLVSLKRIELGL